MLITHKLTKNFLEEEICQGEANGNIGFLLANKKGDYASFFDENHSPVVENSLTTGQSPVESSALLLGHSRYQGWFFRRDNNMFKMVENIELAEKEKSQEIRNEFWRMIRKTQTKTGIIEESFFLPQNHRALVYELSNPLFSMFFWILNPLMIIPKKRDFLT